LLTLLTYVLTKLIDDPSLKLEVRPGPDRLRRLRSSGISQTRSCRRRELYRSPQPPPVPACVWGGGRASGAWVVRRARRVRYSSSLTCRPLGAPSDASRLCRPPAV